MVSSAYYDRIDSASIGPFSSTIMKGMLRGDLGFTGVILSDDLCAAKQLGPWSLGEPCLELLQCRRHHAPLCVSSDTSVMYQAVLEQRTLTPPLLRPSTRQHSRYSRSRLPPWLHPLARVPRRC